METDQLTRISSRRPNQIKLREEHNRSKSYSRGKEVTDLGKEEQEHNDGGDESDKATGECSAVEILIYLWMCI